MYYNQNPLVYLLEKYPDKNWDRWGISGSPNITMKDIEEHPENPWDWSNISRNPNITMGDIENHLENPWNWYNRKTQVGNMGIKFPKTLLKADECFYIGDNRGDTVWGIASMKDIRGKVMMLK